MLAKPTPTAEMVAQAITQSLDRLFKVMLSDTISLLPAGSTPSTPDADDAQIMGCVGFVGEFNGLIYLRFTQTFAAKATSRMVGMDIHEILLEGQEVVKDTIGEMTNMAVGGFANSFSHLGFPCRLTLPTIVRGRNLRTPPIKGAVSHLFAFATGGSIVHVEIHIKPE